MTVLHQFLSHGIVPGGAVLCGCLHRVVKMYM